MRIVVAVSMLALPGALQAQSTSFSRYPASVRPLLTREMKLDEACRGPGDSPSTMTACHRRDAVVTKLNDLGWCWGPENEIEASKRWVRCGPDAHRNS